MRKRRDDGRGQNGCSSSCCGTGCWSRACFNCGIAREGRDGTCDVFGSKGGRESDVAVAVNTYVLDVEDRAVANFTRRIGAGSHSTLEGGFVPSHDEIAVKSVAYKLFMSDVFT